MHNLGNLSGAAQTSDPGATLIGLGCSVLILKKKKNKGGILGGGLESNGQGEF